MPTCLRNFSGVLLAVGVISALGLASCTPATGSRSQAAPVTAPAPAPAMVRHPLQVASLPPEIGGLVRGKINDYGSPDQGFLVLYSGPGMEAKVYLYDAGAANLSEPPDMSVVVEEFRRALNDIPAWVRDGWARDVQVRGSFVLEHAGRSKFLCAQLDIDTTAGHKDAYLFMTLHQGQFVKIFMTGATSKDSRARAMGFATELGDLFWTEPRP